jgi:ATP-binding cassette subfamily B protein
MIPRCFNYLRPYWPLAVLSFVLLLVASALSLAMPWPLKLLVDNVLNGNPVPPALDRFLGPLGETRVELLMVIVAAGFLIALLDSALKVATNYVNTRIEQHMVLDVRSDLFRHTQHMALSHHDQQRSAPVIFAINEQGSAVPGLLMAVQPIAQNALMLIGMFWIVLQIDTVLALLALSVVPLLYYSTGYYAKRIVPRLLRVREMEIESLFIVQEAISMLRVILAFGREQHEFNRFRNQGQEAVDARIKVTIGQTLFSTGVSLSTALGTALVLGYGSYRALQGQITVGELLVVIAYIASVYKPLEAISLTISSLQEKLVALESVFDLLDQESSIVDAPGAVAIARVRGDIEFDDVSFAYQSREDALKGVSFRAHSGQMIGIVGPTGAGKSTLVSLIPRFYEADRGRVLIDGHDIRKVTLRSLRDQVSVVLQEPLLFSGTVGENIRYGRLDAEMDAIVRAAQDANAHDFIMRLPQQYDTQLGERGAQLSGGERQRICIARAFLKDAPILILDEPTSSIDARTEVVILDALERLVVGRTTLMIAHRLSTVRDADIILVVNNGELVEWGAHDELMLRKGLYKQLVDLQMRQARGKPQPVLERIPTETQGMIA